jgi:hypothetical protein
MLIFVLKEKVKLTIKRNEKLYNAYLTASKGDCVIIYQRKMRIKDKWFHPDADEIIFRLKD